MIRTQIYISEKQHQSLKLLATISGKKQSALIREALDLLLQKNNSNQQSWKNAINETRGMWENDEGAQQHLLNIRAEFDRNPSE